MLPEPINYCACTRHLSNEINARLGPLVLHLTDGHVRERYVEHHYELNLNYAKNLQFFVNHGSQGKSSNNYFKYIYLCVQCVPIGVQVHILLDCTNFSIEIIATCHLCW